MLRFAPYAAYDPAVAEDRAVAILDVPPNLILAHHLAGPPYFLRSIFDQEYELRLAGGNEPVFTAFTREPSALRAFLDSPGPR